jgi:hypothetical protein
MEGFTAHSKIVTIGNTLTSTVNLTGANGSSIYCNTIIVTASDATSNALAYLMVPSGVSQYPAISLANGVSGTYGYAAGNTPLSITLGHGKRTRAIQITNISGASRTFIVCYGISNVVNPVDKGYSPQV